MSTNPTTDAGNTACINHFSDGTKIFPQRSCCDAGNIAGNIAGTPLTDAAAFTVALAGGSNVMRDIVKGDFARDLERQLTKSREATAQAERDRGPWRLVSEDQWKCDVCGWFVACGRYPSHMGHSPDCCYSSRPIISRAEAAEADLATARAERDGRETGLMIALKDLAAARAELHESEAENMLLRDALEPLLKYASWTPPHPGFPTGINRFTLITNAKLALAGFSSHETEQGTKAEREGDDALATLAAETAKNAELQGYVRKLARLLGCTDGDDSPELGIKDLIADRAELREKLKVAETAIRTLGRCASCNGSGKPVCTSSDRQECTPNCGCKEPCCYTCKGDGLKGAARKMIADLRGNDKAEKGAGERAPTPTIRTK